jgi:hypothetical protein
MGWIVISIYFLAYKPDDERLDMLDGAREAALRSAGFSLAPIIVPLKVGC